MKSLQNVSTTASEPRWALGSAPAQSHLGCELKSMFDSLTAAPLPDRLAQLADALEEAFHRGELGAPKGRGDA